MAVSQDGEVCSLEIPLVAVEEAPMAKVVVRTCGGRVVAMVVEPVANAPHRLLDPIVADCLLAGCQPKSLLGLEMAAVIARHQMMLIRGRMPNARFDLGNLFKNVTLMIGEALASSYWSLIVGSDGDPEWVSRACEVQGDEMSSTPKEEGKK